MALKKITIIGDIMCEPLMLKAAKREDNGYDFSQVFAVSKSLFEEADYVIGNLETPLAGEKMGFCDDLMSFNSPIELAVAAKQSGIDFVSTANNHCLDRGAEGFYETIRALDRIGLAHSGTFLNADEENVYYADVDGLTLAIVAYVHNMNFGTHRRRLDNETCVNILKPQDDYLYLTQAQKIKPAFHLRVINRLLRPLGYERSTSIKKALGIPYNNARADDYLDESKAEPYILKMQDSIRKAKEKADVVLFYPHLGGQFNLEPGIFTEYVFEKALDAGSDAIIAAHPHVVQKAVMRGNVPCFYSIGNFSMSPNSVYLLHENLPDYGIAVHLYINEKRISQITFSILKIVEPNKQQLTVYPVDELYTTVDVAEKEQLEQQVRQIFKTITQQELVGDIIRREYEFE